MTEADEYRDKFYVPAAVARVTPLVKAFIEKHGLEGDIATEAAHLAANAFTQGVNVGTSETLAQVDEQCREQGLNVNFNVSFPSDSEPA